MAGSGSSGAQNTNICRVYFTDRGASKTSRVSTTGLTASPNKFLTRWLSDLGTTARWDPSEEEVGRWDEWKWESPTHKQQYSRVQNLKNKNPLELPFNSCITNHSARFWVCLHLESDNLKTGWKLAWGVVTNLGDTSVPSVMSQKVDPQNWSSESCKVEQE